MRTSIIIAAHNEGESLWKTVQSCVETCAGLDYEIVIADDASVDDSVEEVQRRFPQLRVVRHEERSGAATTKDLGAREARGDVFVFLDGHCNPEYGAIARLVRDIEELKGNAVVTPTIAGLDAQRWRNSPAQVGHGYFLDLEKFHCGWLPLSELRAVDIGRKRFYESPALIGCVLAVSRQLYEDLWGFDRHMRVWGVEDLDFGLKSWLMGHPILHDPEAVVGHRFRASFDNYDVPVEHTVVNQLRMARKSFTPGVWAEWVDRCRLRHPGRLADRPEGLWARVWELFEEQRASVEQERGYLHARRQRDEFWYAERFGLTWPRLHSAPLVPTTPAADAAAPAPAEAATPAEAMALAASPSPSPSPCPPPSPTITAAPAAPDPQQGLTVPFGTATVSPLGGGLIRKLSIDPNQHVACDCGCGCGDDSCRVGNTPISLTYHSGTVNARPIIQVTLDSGSCSVVPDQIQAQLTFNGVAQGWVTFGTSGHQLGDVYALPLQVASPVASSGIYPWSVEIKSTFSGTVYDRTASDDLPVVVNSSSPFGAGWSVGGILALLIGPRGVAMIDNSTGGHRYFRGTGPSYISPPNDQGTLVRNGDGTFTYTAKDQTKTNFDSTGRMTSQVDAHGLAQTLAYNGNLLSTITQPDGGVATFNYNGNLLGSIQLPGGRSLTPSYDGNNNLTGFTDAAGGVSTFGYDTSNRLVSEQVGPLNTTYAYSPSNGTLSQINRGLGTTLAVTAAAVQGLGAPTAINAKDAVATLTDGLNHTTSYLLDTLGRPLQMKTADNAVQSWTRNAAGDPTSYVDQLNRTTLYAYNATADLTQITHPDGTTTNYQYELTFHQVSQIQDALGRLTKSTYDATTGDLLTQTDALNNVTSYTWANGLKQTMKDALGNVTTLQWDSAKRRQLATIDALGNRTNYSYDAAGNQTVVQDALGHSTTSTYDGNRRLLTRSNALGGVTSNTYDAAGNTLTSVDELGRTTRYVYDQRGLPVSTTEAVGTPQQRTTNTAYDAAGNVLTVTDALGDITRYGYDALNRQVTVTQAYGTSVQRTTTTVHDLVGNIVSKVDALGVATNHVFDAMHRPIQRIEAVGTPLQRTTATTYDAVGNVLTVTNPRGTVTKFVYDDLDRPTQQIDAYGTPLQRTTTTTYDAVGNIVSVMNEVGATTKYVYDALNRRTQVIEAYNSPVQRTTTTAYDAVGNVIAVTNPRGTVTNYGYDALNRRTQQIDAAGTPLQRTLTTSYDAVGNMLSTTNGLGEVTNYGYDALNRRVTQTDAYGTPLQRTTTTIYDAVDNVIATIDPLEYKTNYGYDALNRRISVQNPDGGTTTTAYDGDRVDDSPGTVHHIAYRTHPIRQQPSHRAARNSRQQLQHLLPTHIPRLQRVSRIQIGPNLASVIREAGCRRDAATLRPHVLLDPLTQRIVHIRRSHLHDARYRLLRRNQPVAVVVAVVPRLARADIRLADHVAVLIEGVIPYTVAHQLVGRTRRVAQHRPVAVQVVGVRLDAVVGQLVRGIIRVVRRRSAVERLGCDPAGQIVGVDVIRNVGTAAVQMLQVRQPAHIVVGKERGADLVRACQIAVARLVGHLIALRVGEVLAQRRLARATELNARYPVERVEDARRRTTKRILHQRAIVGRIIGVCQRYTERRLHAGQAIQGVISLGGRRGVVRRRQQIVVGVVGECQRVNLHTGGVVPNLARFAVQQIIAVDNLLPVAVGK